MKRTNFCGIFVAVLTAQAASAQSVSSVQERLDSIVAFDYVSGKAKKQEYGYDTAGRVNQVLYFQQKERVWQPTNRREYFFDEEGNDTLRLISILQGGEWLIVERKSQTSQSNHRVTTFTTSYVKGRMLNSFQTERVYGDDKQVHSETVCALQDSLYKTQVVNEFFYGTDRKLSWVKSTDMMDDKRPRVSTTRYAYDPVGHVIRRTDSVFDGETAKECPRKEYTYEQGALRMSVTTMTFVDGGGQVKHEYIYDRHQNLLYMQAYQMKDEAWRHTGSVSFIYDMNSLKSAVGGASHEANLLDSHYEEELKSSPHKLLSITVYGADGHKEKETLFFYGRNLSTADKPDSM